MAVTTPSTGDDLDPRRAPRSAPEDRPGSGRRTTAAVLVAAVAGAGAGSVTTAAVLSGGGGTSAKAPGSSPGASQSTPPTTPPTTEPVPGDGEVVDHLLAFALAETSKSLATAAEAGMLSDDPAAAEFAAEAHEVHGQHAQRAEDIFQRLEPTDVSVEESHQEYAIELAETAESLRSLPREEQTEAYLYFTESLRSDIYATAIYDLAHGNVRDPELVALAREVLHHIDENPTPLPDEMFHHPEDHLVPPLEGLDEGFEQGQQIRGKGFSCPPAAQPALTEQSPAPRPARGAASLPCRTGVASIRLA